jgi:hypothetical protein
MAATLGVAPLVAPGAAAAAAAPGITLLNVTGSGCKPKTTSAALSLDRTAITVTYSTYSAVSGGSTKAVSADCRINMKIDEVMTKENLVTAPKGTTLDQAREILSHHKIEKLPLVDDDYRLCGLITIKDIQKATRYPNAAKDENGRLICGAAIGVTANAVERAGALLAVGADFLSLDSAHGHSKNIIKCVKDIKAAYPDCQLIAGNIATAEAAEDLIAAGADALKVGIGPGSICTTRVGAGIGFP